MKKPNGLVQLIAGPSGVSMNTNLPFHRSGTGPAGRRAGRAPSLPVSSVHPPRQPEIPDEGRSEKNMRCIICVAIVFASAGFAHALSKEQDDRLAALVQYRQSLGRPAWADIPSSQKPVYAVQDLVWTQLGVCSALGKAYLALPESEQSNPIRVNRIYKELYSACARLDRIQSVMREFSPKIEEQTKKDISHNTVLLQPFMAIYKPHDSDAFCDKARQMLTPNEAAKLLVSTLKY